MASDGRPFNERSSGISEEQAIAVVRLVLAEAAQNARVRVAQLMPNASPEEVEVVVRAVREVLRAPSLGAFGDEPGRASDIASERAAGRADDYANDYADDYAVDYAEDYADDRAQDYDPPPRSRSRESAERNSTPFSYAPPTNFSAKRERPQRRVDERPRREEPARLPSESARRDEPARIVIRSSRRRASSAPSDDAKGAPFDRESVRRSIAARAASSASAAVAPPPLPDAFDSARSSSFAPSAPPVAEEIAPQSSAVSSEVDRTLDSLARSQKIVAERSADEFLSSSELIASAKDASERSFENLTVAQEKDAKRADEYLEELEESAPERDEDELTSNEQIEFLNGRSNAEAVVKNAPMWLASMIAHLALIILLALIVVGVERSDDMGVVSEPGMEDDVVLDEVFDPDNIFEANAENVDVNMPEVKAEVVADAPDVSAFDDETASALSLATEAMSLDSAPLGDVDNLLGSLAGDDLSGRGENKAAALASGGGSEGSEKSVALALAWLAEHQLPNGSWSFSLNATPSCQGRCCHSGTKDSPNAATAMGLLPFLAAGNTPLKGKYKKVVARAVNFLTENGKHSENGTGYNDGGQMYAHGLATIAICETYAMLSEREKSKYGSLRYAAQDAIDFIAYAQAEDGGWRYTPKMEGDTSVVGWQMMALKSGQLAGLSVPDEVVLGARDFLRDKVAIDYGVRYGYTGPTGDSSATSSIGLLCRLYLDWRLDNPQLVQGAARIENIGPDLNNPYYNYYATQLIYNVGGPLWNSWNRKTRDRLIETQCLEGHERGSWYPDGGDSHCATGGRLYVTALNCLVLEVYYRHMPLFQKMENGSQFPLE